MIKSFSYSLVVIVFMGGSAFSEAIVRTTNFANWCVISNDAKLIEDVKNLRDQYIDLGASLELEEVGKFSECSDPQSIRLRLLNAPSAHRFDLFREDINLIFGGNADVVWDKASASGQFTFWGWYIFYIGNDSITRYAFVPYLSDLAEDVRHKNFRATLAEEMFQAVMMVSDKQVYSTPRSLAEEFLSPDIIRKAGQKDPRSILAYINENRDDYARSSLQHNPNNLCLVDAYLIAVRARYGDVSENFDKHFDRLMPIVRQIYDGWVRKGVIKKIC